MTEIADQTPEAVAGSAGATRRALPEPGAVDALRSVLDNGTRSEEWSIDLPGGERLSHRSGMGGGQLSLSDYVTGLDAAGQGVTRVRVIEPSGGDLDETLVREGVTWKLFSDYSVEAVGSDGGKYQFTSGLERSTTAWMAWSSPANEPLLAERTAMLQMLLAEVQADLTQVHLDGEMDIDEYEWLTAEYEANQ